MKLIQIPNFSLYHKNRETPDVKDKFYYKEWLDLDVFEEGFFESKFCEVAIKNKFKFFYQKYIAFQILFLEITAQKMRFANSFNYSVIMFGTDQNLNHLRISQHQNTDKSLDICLENKMILSIY